MTRWPPRVRGVAARPRVLCRSVTAVKKIACYATNFLCIQWVHVGSGLPLPRRYVICGGTLFFRSPPVAWKLLPSIRFEPAQNGRSPRFPS